MVSPNVTTPLAVPDECPFGQHGCIPAGCIAAVKPEFYEFPTRATCILDVFYVASKLFYVEVLRWASKSGKKQMFLLLCF